MAYKRRQAVKGVRGRPTARTHSVPAPIGGLNAVDSVAAMPPTDAVICDNWFPEPTFVSLRKGYVSQSTGLPGWVETLMGYSNLSTTESLFAISGTAVYDCTVAGAVGAAVVTGLTNARWEYTNVSVPSGTWLYAANGVDTPLAYNGTSWVKVTAVSTPAITGVTTTLLRAPAVWKSRLWFIENNTNKVWYLPIQSIGGAATSFDLSTVFRLGGSLQAIVTFSVASATSFDDFIGFVSTEGEMAVYTGTDPASSATFAITGVYEVGKPVGRRCFFNYGSDVVLITANGLVSATKAISVGLKNPKDLVSYKILNLINADVQAYSANYGWEGVCYPIGNKVLLNVPENTNSRYHQFVMNTITGSWCTYGYITSPWNAATMCVLGNNLYFGSNTTVARADVGYSDGLSQITGSLKPAFQYFGTDKQKRFTMVRPLLQTTGNVTPTMSLNVDFENTLPTTSPTFSTSTAALWNVALWNVSYWATGPIIQKNWQTIYGIGFSATIYLTVAAKIASVNLQSLDYVMEDGAVL